MTQVTKRYKYRLYPTKSQCDLLARFFGCARKVWNECLGQSIKEYENWKVNPDQPKPGVSAIDFNRKLTQLKAELPYLREVAAVPLQQVTRVVSFARYVGLYIKNSRSRIGLGIVMGVELDMTAITMQQLTF